MPSVLLWHQYVNVQILQRVLKGCSQTMLRSLSLTACQFMEEPGMAVQVRESKHPYDNNTNFEVCKLQAISSLFYCLMSVAAVSEVEHYILVFWHLHFFSLQDKVHIPGAIYLSVKFDSRCYTEEGCDELIMSSSSDFLQDVHNFSGSPQKWSDFEIPGEETFVFFLNIQQLFST